MKTGVAPTREMTSRVLIHVNGTVMTSSPGLTPNAIIPFWTLPVLLTNRL